MIKDKSTTELVKKQELISECIEDIVEVFEDTDYTRTDIINSIKFACEDILLKVREENNLDFNYRNIYMISRIPQTSDLSDPDCVWTINEFCVETGYLLVGIQTAEDIKKIVYRYFYNACKVNIYRVREEYTPSLRNFIKESEYKIPNCIIVEPWDIESIAEVLKHSYIDYIPAVSLSL